MSSNSTPPKPDSAQDDRLESWKEIAAYFHREVRTVQRWEKKESLPVHRHLHDKLGSVYAFKAELDAWSISRRSIVEAEDAAEEDVEEIEAAEPAPLAAAAAGAAASRARMLGKTISHYLIQEQLGAGGMGVVYRARDERLGRDVALKLLPADAIGDAAARNRLEREARTASALNHPNVCTIYDVGEAEGQVYLAMEFVAGQPLSRSIPAQGLPEASIVRIGTQISDALEHAHQHGIIHRDLKSSNVMLTPDGRAKILDFGLAVRRQKDLGEVTRILDFGPAVRGQDDLGEVTFSRGSLADTGTMSGTLSYMAPEVLRGHPADARSDMWALGVIVYQMAVGHLPFQGKSGFDLTSSILRDATPPLPQRVSPSLAGMVRRCLEKEPAQRYQRAGEVRAALEAISLSTASIPAAQAPRAKTAHRKGILAAAAILVAAALVIAGFLIWPRPEVEGGRLMIAVLPFENLSGDPEQEYLSDGLTEEMISQLGRLNPDSLGVIARQSSIQQKNSKKTLSEIGRDLKVNYIMNGSVRLSKGDPANMADDRVRITANLSEVNSNTQVWSESYDRRLSDVLDVQSEVAQAIASAIRVKFTPQQRARLASTPPVNREAYQNYLKGRYQLNRRDLASMQHGLDYFGRAVAADPNFALAYAGIADTYHLLGFYSALPPTQAYPEAKKAAEKALSLDDSLAEAYTTLADVQLHYEYDWKAAEQGFRSAIQRNPNYAVAHHWYAVLLALSGRSAESRTEIEHALKLDPTSLAITGDMALHYFYAGQYDQTIAQSKMCFELDPNYHMCHFWLGRAYVEKKMYAEAIAEFRRTVELQPENLMAVALLGHAYAVSGQPAKAREVIRNLERLSTRRYVGSANFAIVYCGLGEIDHALEWIERAYQQRDPLLTRMKLDPVTVPLRSDPRFADLLRRVGFQP